MNKKFDIKEYLDNKFGEFIKSEIFKDSLKKTKSYLINEEKLKSDSNKIKEMMLQKITLISNKYPNCPIEEIFYRHYKNYEFNFISLACRYYFYNETLKFGDGKRYDKLLSLIFNRTRSHLYSLIKNIIRNRNNNYGKNKINEVLSLLESKCD